MIVAREVVSSKNQDGFIIKETHKDLKTHNVRGVYVSYGSEPFRNKEEADKYLIQLNLKSPVKKAPKNLKVKK